MSAARAAGRRRWLAAAVVVLVGVAALVAVGSAEDRWGPPVRFWVRRGDLGSEPEAALLYMVPDGAPARTSWRVFDNADLDRDEVWVKETEPSLARIWLSRVRARLAPAGTVVLFPNAECLTVTVVHREIRGGVEWDECVTGRESVRGWPSDLIGSWDHRVQMRGEATSRLRLSADGTFTAAAGAGTIGAEHGRWASEGSWLWLWVDAPRVARASQRCVRCGRFRLTDDRTQFGQGFSTDPPFIWHGRRVR
jgi:hypothetical protein